MARISLIEEADHPELAPLIDRIKAGRRGGLLNVYKLLLHAPAPRVVMSAATAPSARTPG